MLRRAGQSGAKPPCQEWPTPFQEWLEPVKVLGPPVAEAFLKPQICFAKPDSRSQTPCQEWPTPFQERPEPVKVLGPPVAEALLTPQIQPLLKMEDTGSPGPRHPLPEMADENIVRKEPLPLPQHLPPNRESRRPWPGHVLTGDLPKHGHPTKLDNENCYGSYQSHVGPSLRSSRATSPQGRTEPVKVLGGPQRPDALKP